jgi:hypothetical protein
VHTIASSTVTGVTVDDRLVTTFAVDRSVGDLDPDPHRGRFVIGPLPTQQPAFVVTTEDNPLRLLLDVIAYELDVLAAGLQQIANEAFIETAGQNGAPSFAMRLHWQGGTLADDRWPASLPDPHRFIGDGSSYQLVTADGTIVARDLISLTPVSEPACPWLLALSLAALDALRRRQPRARTASGRDSSRA